MKSRWSILLETKNVYRLLFLFVLPLFFLAERYRTFEEFTILLYLFVTLLSALSFRRIWIQVMSSGFITYFSHYHLIDYKLLIFFFHWLSTFAMCSFILILIEKYLDEKKNMVDLIHSLANSLDSRDKNTALHSSNVAEYSRKIAEEMKLSKRKCENIYFGGLLHDIGKIGVPEDVLNKPMSLTNSEYELIKQHPVTGYNLVKHIKRFKDQGILDMILYHHERFDGKGYPSGLKGEEIPLEARIIGVADAFDAMTSKRIYQNTEANWKEALAEMERHKGTQFDPKVVTVFVKLFRNEVHNETYSLMKKRTYHKIYSS